MYKMSKCLELKDSLYYSDLIAELKEIAGFEKIADATQIERISQRRKKVLTLTQNECLQYDSSRYSIEFMNIARNIYIKATGEDGLAWFEQLRCFPNEIYEAIQELENKKLENEILIQLMSVVKYMGLENKISLGQPTEQCICLNKNGNSWEIYIVERGISFEKSVYEDCFDACVEVINQLADSKQMFEEAKEKFGMVRKLVPNK